MKNASDMLDKLKIKHESKIISAHRTPDLLFDYASSAESQGIEIIIAGAGGSAHLPGMTASKTHLPVIGVPIKTKSLEGIDSLLSIVQMPKGIPVGTVAIGNSGAINSALLAASILSNKYPDIRNNLIKYRSKQTRSVLANRNPKK
jgi:5-(carboxyamino)imidazole ribonucleotide mutase